jgi:hypothetical protein
MILPGIEILRGGHGKYGLRSTRVLSPTYSRVAVLGVPGDAGTILCDLVIFRCPFRQGSLSVVRQ